MYDSLLDNQWHEFRINSSAYWDNTATTATVGISIPSGTESDFYIDNLSIHAIPTCLRPEQPQVANVTSTTATVSWNTTNATQTIIYLNDGTSTQRIIAGSNPYTLTGLTPDTYYSFQLRGLCSTADSSELNPYPVAFHTPCVAAATPLFSENFESTVNQGQLPQCWESGWLVKPNSNTLSTPFTSTTSYKLSGQRSMSFRRQAAGSVAYLASHALPIDSANKYRVALSVYRRSTVAGECLKVWASPQPTDTAGGTLLGTINHNYADAPTEATPGWYSYEYLIPTVGTQYILIEGVARNGADLCFDDMNVQLAPECMAVKGILFDEPTQNSVDMHWTAGRAESNWTVSYTIRNSQNVTVKDTVVNVSGTPRLTIADMDQMDIYDLQGQIRAVCLPGDTAEARTFHRTVQPGCTPVSQFPFHESFESSSQNFPALCWMNFNAGSGTELWTRQANSDKATEGTSAAYIYYPQRDSRPTLITPPMAFVGGTPYEVKFSMYRSQSGENQADEALHVLVNNQPDTLGATEIGYVSQYYGNAPRENTTGIYYYTFAIPQTATGTQYVILSYHANYVSEVYIDDLTIRESNGCSEIKGSPSAYNVLSQEMHVEINDTSVTDWQVSVAPQGTDPELGILVNVSGRQDTLVTGLTPDTYYTVRARRVCGAVYSDWSVGTAAHTMCLATTVPFTDDFENAPTNDYLGGCYTVEGRNDYKLHPFRQNNNATGNDQYNSTEDGSVGICIAYSQEGSHTAVTSADMTMSRLFHFLPNRNYQVSIDAKRSTFNNYDYDLEFRLGRDRSSATQLGGLVPVTNTTFETKSAYFTVETEDDYILSIVARGRGTYHEVFLDELSVREISCMPPTAVSITNLKADSATLNLVGTASLYEIAVSNTTIDPRQGVTGNVYHNDSLTTTSVSIGGLAANTDYYYTIRAICNGTPSDWMTPGTFRTRCNTIELPYEDGFENTQSIRCWSTTGTAGSVGRTTSEHYMGTGAMDLNQVTAISPEMNITDASNIALNGWMKASDATAVLTIGVMNDPDDITSAEMLVTVPVTSAGQWGEFTVDLSALADDDYAELRQARYIVLSSGDKRIYVDDLYISTIPTCPKPTPGQISHITGYQAELSWTEAGAATAWNVRAVSSSAPTVEARATTVPFVLTGLQPNTTYEVTVAAICSATDTSRYSLIGSFKTECAALTVPFAEGFENFPTDRQPECWSIEASTTSTATSNNKKYVWGVYSTQGKKMIRLYNYFTDNGDAIISTPGIELNQGRNYAFSFDYCHQASCSDLYVEIVAEDGTITRLDTFSINGTGTSAFTPSAWNRVIVPVRGFDGQTAHIRLNVTANFGNGAIFVDNIAMEELLSCSDPQNLNLTYIDNSEARFAFEDTCQAHTQWQYALVQGTAAAETVQPQLINAKQISLTGLTAETAYTLYLRSDCGQGDTSHWVSLAFETTALPAQTPYICQFDNATENALWHTLGRGTNQFTIGQDSALSHPGALYVSNDGQSYGYTVNQASIAVADRVLNLASGEYRISYDWICSGGYSSNHFFRAYLLPANEDYMPRLSTDQQSAAYTSFTWPENLIALDGNTYHNLTYGPQHSETAVNLTGAAGIYRLVFIWNNSLNNNGVQSPLLVDNIEVMSTACRAVDNLRVSEAALTATTAEARFLNREHDSIRYVVSTSPVVEDSLYSGLTTGTSCQLAGLQAGTSYYLMVRRECSTTSHSGWTTAKFNTVCAPVTDLPMVEDFENPEFPSVCWQESTVAVGKNMYGDQDGHWERNVSSTGANGHASMKLAQGAGAAALLASPEISFTTDHEYHISFEHSMGSTEECMFDAYNIYLSPTATKSGARLVATVSAYDNAAVRARLYSADVELPIEASGNYRVLLEGVCGASSRYNTLYVDDIVIDEYPTCRPLAGRPQAEAVTATTADVSATLGRQSSVQFGIAPYTTTVSPADITLYMSSTTGRGRFTGLTANSQYALFARAICSLSGDTTAWTSMQRFATKATDCFAPENIRTIGSAADTHITLCWNDIPDAVTVGYELQSAQDTITGTTQNDTLALSGLTPETAYRLLLSGYCSDDTVATVYNFRTTATPAALPYQTGFEDQTDNALWSVSSSIYNNLCFGTDAEGRNAGSRGLYVTADGQSYSQILPSEGSTYNTVNSVAAVTRTLRFDHAGTYEVAFDWRSNPTANSSYWTKASARSFIAPADIVFQGDNAQWSDAALPAGSIALVNNMEGQIAWTRHEQMVNITEPGLRQIVFLYTVSNQYSYGRADELTDRPLAVDNLSVTEVTCMPVNAIDLEMLTDTAARVVVWKNDAETIEWGVTTAATADSIASLNVVGSSNASDTLLITGLSPATAYHLFVRQSCDSLNRSSWRQLSFETTVTPAAMPYICGFEQPTENARWQIIGEGQTNYFVVGQAASNGGLSGLYITNDGTAHAYSNNSSSTSFAQRVLYLEPGTYDYSFDWLCQGEAPSTDYGRAFIAPRTFSPEAGTSRRVADNAIMLDGNAPLAGVAGFRTRQGQFNISRADSYKLTFVWTNNYTDGENPPMAVDNIVIQRQECATPQAEVVTSLTDDHSVTVRFSSIPENAQIRWALTDDGTFDHVSRTDTIVYQDETAELLIDNLTQASGYTFICQTLCENGSESSIATLPLSTLCGLVTDFPFIETFESQAADGTHNTMASACWTITATEPSFTADIVALGALNGSRSLMLDGSTSSSNASVTVGLPEMDSINLLGLVFNYAGTFSTAADRLEVGYIQGQTFTALEQLTPQQGSTEHRTNLSRVPSSARRIAFRYQGPNTAIIDNIHVARQAAAPLIYDTVCFNSPYSGHGFAIPQAQISEGDNIFTRTELATRLGQSDSTYTLHLFRLQEIVSTEHDTVCEGSSYNVGLWQIANPRTDRYFTTFPGAAHNGCDSTVELFLYVVPQNENLFDTICFGESYLLGDTTLTTTGTYVRQTVGPRGCTQSITMHLYVEPDTIRTAATVCEASLPYTWHGRQLSQPGRYTEPVTNRHGCTQTELLTLTVTPADSTINVTICQGGQAFVFDTVITTAGRYDLTRVIGTCDIVFHINATVTPAVRATVYDDACENRPYTGYGLQNVTISADTMFLQQTKTAEMCDSITEVHITLHPTEHSDTAATINRGEVFNWHDQSYTEAGEYQTTLSNRFGCDSIVTLTLSVIDGVENVSENGRMRIAPNPVRPGAEALVLTESTGSIARVEIINSFGSVIARFTVSSTPITVTAPSVAGIYYIRLVTTDGRTYIDKLMVE